MVIFGKQQGIPSFINVAHLVTYSGECDLKVTKSGCKMDYFSYK